GDGRAKAAGQGPRAGVRLRRRAPAQRAPGRARQRGPGAAREVLQARHRASGGRADRRSGAVLGAVRRSDGMAVKRALALVLCAACQYELPDDEHGYQVEVRDGTSAEGYLSNGERGSVMITEVNWA